MATLPNLGVAHMIKSTTSTVAQVFTTTSSALDMLSEYVQTAKKEQAIDYKIRLEAYSSKAIERAGLEEAERILELDAFSSKSNRHHELLTASMEKYAKLIYGENYVEPKPEVKQETE